MDFSRYLTPRDAPEGSSRPSQRVAPGSAVLNVVFWNGSVAGAGVSPAISITISEMVHDIHVREILASSNQEFVGRSRGYPQHRTGYREPLVPDSQRRVVCGATSTAGGAIRARRRRNSTALEAGQASRCPPEVLTPRWRRSGRRSRRTRLLVDTLRASPPPPSRHPRHPRPAPVPDPSCLVQRAGVREDTPRDGIVPDPAIRPDPVASMPSRTVRSRPRRHTCPK